MTNEEIIKKLKYKIMSVREFHDSNHNSKTCLCDGKIIGMEYAIDFLEGHEDE